MKADDRVTAIFREIKRGIDEARKQGVICGYPTGASVDRQWVVWPWREENEGDLTDKESY